MTTSTAGILAAILIFGPPPARAQTPAAEPGAVTPQAPALGRIEFPTSGSGEAQEAFLRGVLWMHSFEYDEAADAFREAQRLDPGFAMAYWGEAMSYTHPMWNEQDLEAARGALERLGPTPEARAAKAPTEREKAYLQAVEALYGEGSKAARDTAYSLAMAELVERFPEDREAKAFYALSLMGLSQGVRDIPTYMRAASIAQEVFVGNPRHPGAAHYLIHAFDDPVHAPLGLRAARAYSGIAPDAAHAQHMTTHIFVALGMWDRVVSQNEIAAAEHHLPGHYTSWLAYGLQQQGRFREARALLEEVRANMDGTEPAPAGQRAYLASMRLQYLVDTRRWEDPVADWELDVSGLSATSRGEDAFADGLAALGRGDAAEAERALAELTRLAEEARPDGAGAGRGGGAAAAGAADPYTLVPTIQAKELEAILLAADGRRDEAIARAREAASIEDGMPFVYGPPPASKPTHELAGELLLDAGRPSEAEAEFRRALELAPGRPLSLAGLARAAEAAGDAAEAARARESLREVWHRADPGVALVPGEARR